MSVQQRIQDLELKIKDHPRWREIQPEHPAEDSVLFQVAGGVGINPEDNETQDWTNWDVYGRDHIAMMCLHRLFVRQLETQEDAATSNSTSTKSSGCISNAKRWIFKDPNHIMNHMEAIVKVYPNAKFIWMHRSLTDAVQSYLRNAPEDFSAKESSQQALAINLISGLRQGMAFRQSGKYEDGDLNGKRHKCYPNVATAGKSQENRFHDVFLDDLLADPLQELEKLYNKFGMNFSEAYQQRIREWQDGGDKRDAIQVSGRGSLGDMDMNTLGILMRRNRDYFNRFPRTCPKGMMVVDRDEDGNKCGIIGNFGGFFGGT